MSQKELKILKHRFYFGFNKYKSRVDKLQLCGLSGRSMVIALSCFVSGIMSSTVATFGYNLASTIDKFSPVFWFKSWFNFKLIRVGRVDYC